MVFVTPVALAFEVIVSIPMYRMITHDPCIGNANYMLLKSWRWWVET